MNRCYSRINAHVVDIVDLHIFGKSSAMNAFMSEEKRRLGISTSAFEVSFFALHDAWRGTPRIMIACDKMSSLPKLVGIGGLHHELAHTVLHGSPEYYLFAVPIFVLRLETDGVISRQIMGDLLYLASVAVKDYEVTRLLYGKGFVRDQVAYNRYFLKPSEEDQEAWKIAEGNKTARILVLVSLLKTAFCAAPLLEDQRYGTEMSRSIYKSMSYLPADLSMRLLKILGLSSMFGESTQRNMDLLMEKIVHDLILWNIA